MTNSPLPPQRTDIKKIRLPSAHSAASQQGVVLIIALILLVVISLLAVSSMRGAGSAESVAGNVRTTELATQAAEIALRHCESSAIQVVKVNGGDTTSAQATYAPTFAAGTFALGSIATASPVQWQNTTLWDGGTTSWVLPLSMVGGTSTYKRAPECMIESLTGAPPTVGSSTGNFVITARGFGPEVAAGTGRPQGSEVWLQSTIEIN
jgi:type IV pilus assembly protein PilX